MLWGVFALKCSIFQKFAFFQTFNWSNLILNRLKICKNLGLNQPGSIDARLMLDRSKLLFDWSNLIFDRLKFERWVFKKVFLSRVLHTFQIFSKALSLFYVDRSNLSLFCRFLPKFSQVFLSLSAGKTFFSIKITFFMHFP